MTKKLISYIILIFLTVFLASCDFFGSDPTTTASEETTVQTVEETTFDFTTEALTEATTTTNEAPTTTIEETTTAATTATTEVITYTVNFYDTDGTTLLESLTVESGSTFVLPIPEKQYYDFTGWYSNDVLYEEGPINQDLDLNAHWLINLGKWVLALEGSIVIPDCCKEIVDGETIVKPEDVEDFYLFFSNQGYTREQLITEPFELGIETINQNLEQALVSKILHATISRYLFAFGEGDNPLFTVPTYRIDGLGLRYFEQGVELIDKTELSNLFQLLETLDVDFMSDLETIDISVFVANIHTVTDSSIIHHFLSNQVINVLTAYDFELINFDDISNEIIITLGIDTYITEVELISFLAAIDALNLNDVNDFSPDGLSIDGLLSNMYAILDSSLMHQVLSQCIHEFTNVVSLTVPSTNQDGEPITIDVGNFTYISKEEITCFFDALKVIGFTDFSNFQGNVSLSSLDSMSINVLLQSTIMNVLLTKQILDSNNLGGVVPDELLTSINTISQIELQNFISAYISLGYSDLSELPSIDDLAGKDSRELNSILRSVLLRYILHEEFVQVALDNDITLTSEFYETDDQDYLLVVSCLNLIGYYSS